MKGLLSKVEYIVIGVLALIFLMWTASKCNAHKEEAQSAEAIEAREDSLAQAANKPANALPPIPQPTQQPAAPASNPGTYTPINGEPATAPTPAASGTLGTQSTTAQPATAAESAAPKETAGGGSKLFVTIDKLKVRKTPGLKGELLGELKLFDEVFYMNEVTDSTYVVNLGKEKADEPYVKIKTKRGTVGWVYGAGVHYVKKKRSGVLE
jgi:hypothetical protein